jgi:ribosomal protein L21E
MVRVAPIDQSAPPSFRKVPPTAPRYVGLIGIVLGKSETHTRVAVEVMTRAGFRALRRITFRNQ